MDDIDHLDGDGAPNGGNPVETACSSSTCHPYDVGYFCDPNGAGGACRVNEDCLSVVCQGGVCACAPAAGSCAIAADCCDRPCSGGMCQFIATGQLCRQGHPEECSSGSCNPIDVGCFCDPNGAGGTCRVSEDCTTGRTCNAVTCT